MRKATYIALALCAALCSPTMARAEEINYIDSFANGFETLKGESVNEQVTPEKDYEEEYRPVLMDVETRETEGEVSILSQINTFIKTGLTTRYDETQIELWAPWGIRKHLRDAVVPVAVLFVFFWWGLRKSKNIIMSAFRKGKANV